MFLYTSFLRLLERLLQFFFSYFCIAMHEAVNALLTCQYSCRICKLCWLSRKRSYYLHNKIRTRSGVFARCRSHFSMQEVEAPCAITNGTHSKGALTNFLYFNVKLVNENRRIRTNLIWISFTSRETPHGLPQEV